VKTALTEKKDFQACLNLKRVCENSPDEKEGLSGIGSEGPSFCVPDKKKGARKWKFISSHPLLF
jgi:hypothetical protein